jgi:hypothetical protein
MATLLVPGPCMTAYPYNDWLLACEVSCLAPLLMFFKADELAALYGIE